MYGLGLCANMERERERERETERKREIRNELESCFVLSVTYVMVIWRACMAWGFVLIWRERGGREGVWGGGERKGCVERVQRRVQRKRQGIYVCVCVWVCV